MAVEHAAKHHLTERAAERRKQNHVCRADAAPPVDVDRLTYVKADGQTGFIGKRPKAVKVRVGIGELPPLSIFSRSTGHHEGLVAEIDDLLHRAFERIRIPPVAKDGDWNRAATV